MELVFSTDQYTAPRRYTAWRDAICDVYVHVEVKATNPDQYRGFIREAKFGDVALTDILLSEQRIRRNDRHIAMLDKECYYFQLIHTGKMSVIQRGETHRSNAARGAIFSATEPYELQAHGEVRSFYLELPRHEFAQRFPHERIPVSASLNATHGLGRIASEFCATLAAEDAKIDGGVRANLGNQLMDLLALSLLTPNGDMPMAERSVKKARLRSVQQWIEAHLVECDLSLEKIASANGMSLRYLHVLFEACEMSASEWIWNRRLQLTYEGLANSGGRSITSIALDNGFNSPAHFSTMFRRKYGVSPREVVRPESK